MSQHVSTPDALQRDTQIFAAAGSSSVLRKSVTCGGEEAWKPSDGVALFNFRMTLLRV